MNYLKVMDHAYCDGYQFNIGTTNIWKPQAVSSEEQGGFKFFNEDANYFDKFFHLTMKEGLIRSVGYDIFSEKLIS